MIFRKKTCKKDWGEWNRRSSDLPPPPPPPSTWKPIAAPERPVGGSLKPLSTAQVELLVEMKKKELGGFDLYDGFLGPISRAEPAGLVPCDYCGHRQKPAKRCGACKKLVWQ